MKDEKLWKDVTSQAPGGILVVISGYLVAVSNGLLKVPSVQDMLTGILLIGAGAGLFSTFVLTYQNLMVPLHDKIPPPWNEVVDTGIKIVVIVAAPWLIGSGVVRFFSS